MNPRSAPPTSIAESSTSVQHTARAQRPQAFEQRRNLAQIADRCGRGRLVHLRLAVGEEKHDLGAAAAAEPDAIAVRQRLLGNLVAVDVGPVPGGPILQDETAVRTGRDLRVIA